MLKEKGEKIQALTTELNKVVVGQTKMVQRLLIGLFTNGHVLLEGVPGLAKTLTINTLAKALDLNFSRIQFTPDLLPADLIGTMIYNQASGKFEVKKGPIFSNLILADEINRSPAKVQSALLEAMQEQQVSIGDTTFELPEPFLVLATQNPIDQEGTYPLPEAQVDRFMMKVFVSYPSKEEEKAIMRRMARTKQAHKVEPVFSEKDIFEVREIIDEIQLSGKLEDYIIDIIMATRNPEEYGLPKLAEYIEYGVSPRASLALNLGAKAHAFMEGRSYVLPEDVKEIAPDVLNHRIILNYEAEAEEVSTVDCVDLILRSVEF
ncbi:AAA family ATPase [Pontibacter sp. G13]|uniref:AAA family ATPase n=1 Tax=Pontibacter sp. G13 TaxID=3074898 RepID=UPI00288B7207|nr:AAA family ATPase [Pontibacter sp. G13]WNJ21512.1 AAA family ATPase [Pontibacter sp. G13]